jgi:hypothetical protein
MDQWAGGWGARFEQRWRCSGVEPMTGIEPAYSAWEADVLPLNYIGEMNLTCKNSVQ